MPMLTPPINESAELTQGALYLVHYCEVPPMGAAHGLYIMEIFSERIYLVYLAPPAPAQFLSPHCVSLFVGSQDYGCYTAKKPILKTRNKYYQ
jgi:hypothetical protein